MRGMAASGIATTMILAACGLGVVDLPADPAPARLLVTSEIAADPTDPSRVHVVVSATLDPGIEPDGTPRRVASNVLRVEDIGYAPSQSGDPSRPTWLATESYPTPGPEAVRLGLPRLEGLGLSETLRMRVRVAVAPGRTIVLGDGQDLVITAEPPSNPAQTLHWSLYLTSSSMPTYRLQTGGSDSWPAEVRVPAGQIPTEALPLKAMLRIRWDRSVNLLELTPDERYDLALRSIMVVAWTIEAAI